MEHLDEGTVHAWLDGALPPDESSRIERHVSGCAECAAAVAEARGLIAASSRILSALDDVPRVAAPGRQTVDGRGEMDGEATPSVRAAGEEARDRAALHGPGPARRAWWFKPRYAAAAGLAVIAFGSLVVVRNRGEIMSERTAAPTTSPVAADAAAEAKPRAAAGAAAERLSVDPAASTARAVPPAAVAPAPMPASPAATPAAAAQDVATGASMAKRAKSDVGAAANEVVPPRAEGRADARANDRPPAAVAAPSAPALPRSPVVTTMSRRPVTQEQAAREQVATLREAARDSATRAEGAVAAVTPQRLSPALRADDIAKAEQRRIAGEPKVEATVVTDAASAIAKATRQASDVLGCWVIERSDAARAAGLPSRVQLLDREAGLDGQRPTYLVRDVDGTKVSAAAWRWSLDEEGTLVMLRGTGSAATRLWVSTLSGERRLGHSTARRETCPT